MMPPYHRLVMAIVSSPASGSGKWGEVKTHQTVEIKEANVKTTSRNLSNILEIFLHSSPIISFLSSALYLSSIIRVLRSFQGSFFSSFLLASSSTFLETFFHSIAGFGFCIGVSSSSVLMSLYSLSLFLLLETFGKTGFLFEFSHSDTVFIFAFGRNLGEFASLLLTNPLVSVGDFFFPISGLLKGIEFFL